MMERSSKKLEMEEDRISELPDEILHHILSKIDVEEAVQTSILSKRWKNLWSSLPDLSFNLKKLNNQSDDTSLAWSHHIATFMPRFEHFVLQFLSHRDISSSIHKFQLSSTHLIATDSSFVAKCLDYAINQGVQHLDLDAYCLPKPLKFPDRLFASKTLRVLELKQYTRSVVIPKPFILSSLNCLYLESFEFRDDDDPYSFTKEPFSSFPNLEKLTLHRCGVSGLIISASKLKILEISFQDPLCLHEKKIEKISTPLLTSFRYEGYGSLVCSNVDVPRLEEVYFDISPILESPYTEDIKKQMPLTTIRMLQQLGNAELVTLTSATIEVLEMDLHLIKKIPSPFPNIKCLKLIRRSDTIHPKKTVPETVKNYLTKGSSYVETVVVKYTKGIKV